MTNRDISAPLSASAALPRRAAKAFAAALHRGLDIIYPPTCIACRAATQTHGTLCPACWGRIRFVERPYCEQLGTPFQRDLGPGIISPEAIADPPMYARARMVALFQDGPARQLVHRLKYGDRTDLARPMGLWMARAGRDILDDADLLVPVPMHWRRLFARQFNQAAALAAVVAKAANVPLAADVLQRAKSSPPQVGLTKAQRAENVQGSFVVPPEAKLRLEKRKIVLVDDVLTSGATANAAARVLLRHGAARVDVLIFARVVTPS
ncbi:ComF family protein [Methylovirgula sp. 4M-Z18]|uniref:ComF family protein n=1 Tax=Methylovirgula sp. 4M-Z18 TaxID=2293567 RepID=UPI000E2ED8D4|nr:ComF family protein [Methylovirgula sp. 4M-Z18]RFB81307.1 ComF family protein [Methylovirgula sp. 4M-Z18]